MINLNHNIPVGPVRDPSLVRKTLLFRPSPHSFALLNYQARWFLSHTCFAAPFSKFKTTIRARPSFLALFSLESSCSHPIPWLREFPSDNFSDWWPLLLKESEYFLMQQFEWVRVDMFSQPSWIKHRILWFVDNLGCCSYYH